MKPIRFNPLLSTLVLLLLLVLLLFLSISVIAKENQNTKGESPYFFVISSDPAIDQLPLKSMRTNVSIAGCDCRRDGHAGVEDF
jgi:hypothetical protein